MTATVLRNVFLLCVLAACAAPRASFPARADQSPGPEVADQPLIDTAQKPQSLMELRQTEEGGFVLQPGFYEAEFKTYCLQPGTPDPHRGDAYLQGPLTGYRRDIVEGVLLASREQPRIDQKNVQLLLWSVVSGSSFSSLPLSVQADAAKLLTPRQVFELKGGWVGVIKNVTYQAGLLNANSDLRRLFETSMASYEAYERIAVRSEPAQVVHPGVKADQWYRQPEGYFVRYYPESYKKVKIQVYVPGSVAAATDSTAGDYVVFDPTGQQAVPAFTNAQRLGIGAPVIDIVRKVIRINKRPAPPKKIPGEPKAPETAK